MDLLSILTSSENLYKYLLIGGIGMLILSLFYPIDKRYELSQKRDLYNKEINLLNFEIEQLKKKTTDLKEISSNTIHFLDSINNNDKGDLKVRKNLKESFNSQLDSLQKSRVEISVKEIEVNYNKQQILTLESNIQDFVKYENIFFWAGIIFAIAGIVGWFILMKKAKSP
jgi:hypothetical protein